MRVTPSGLIVPGGAGFSIGRGYDDKEPKYVCRVPVGRGETCGKLFYEGEQRAWERHVGRCAQEHRAEIHEASRRTRLPFLAPDAWDPELEAHFKRVGRRMLQEGRLVMRRNERANG